MRIAFVLALAAALVAGNVQAQDGVTITGAVVDSDGKPAAGVEVANFWIGKRDFFGFGKGVTMTSYQGVKTDQDGKFSISVPAWMPEPALLAISADRKLGALATVKPKESNVVPPMTLSPLVKVTGRFDCKELGRKPPWTNVYVTTEKRARLLQSDSSSAEFAFLLPAGKYRFNGYGTDVKGIDKDLEVPADKSELDLGVIDLPATMIAKHVGKEPPAWTVTDARGLPKTVTLADLKGKWVLIEFWGFW